MSNAEQAIVANRFNEEFVNNDISVETILPHSLYVTSNVYISGTLYYNGEALDTGDTFTGCNFVTVEGSSNFFYITGSNYVDVNGDNNIIHISGSNVNIHTDAVQFITSPGSNEAFECSSNVNFVINENVYFKKLFVDSLYFVDCNPCCSNDDTPIYILNSNVAFTIASNLHYDGSWNLSLTDIPENEDPGTLIGNGKIGIISTTRNISASCVNIAACTNFANGKYVNNVIQPFNCFTLKFYDNDNDKVSYDLVTQTLNMNTAILSTEMIVSHSSSGNSINMSYDMYAVRHLPYCVMQTVKITPNNSTPNELNFFHEVFANSDIKNIEFNNNTIFNDSISNKGIFVLIAKGKHVDIGDVVCVSAYVFETMAYENFGFNIYRCDAGRCYQKFKLYSFNNCTTHKFHILSTILTTFDFENPLEEAKRITLTILNREVNMQSSICKLRQLHVSAWNSIWKTTMNISPRCSATIDEQQSVVSLRKHIRYSLYNIYSSIRSETVVYEVSPNSLSVIDMNGTILYSGDMWFIPFLIFFKPDVARSVLEYRYATLQQAIKLAASYGFKGSKFPYENDIIGYKNAMYWDTYSSLTVFNSAMICHNVWNYYRITKDREWLQQKGYPILKATAEFLTSVVTKDPDTTLHLRNTRGLSAIESEDNSSFTNNLIRLALKATIEASYELMYSVKEAWTQVFYKLPVPTYPLSQRNIVKFDANSTVTDAIDIAEPLFVLAPYLSKLFFSTDSDHPLSTTYLENVSFYTSKLLPEFYDNPYNTALVAIMYGMHSQYDKSYISSFESALSKFVDDNTNDSWGNFMNSGTQDTCKRNKCVTTDVTVASMFIMIMLQSMAGLEIQGGVADTRFYYEEMRVQARVTSIMPYTWDKLTLCNVGDMKSFNIYNANK